ncbi:MAG: hypothetical protein QMC80_02300 [Thermoplasmatales archaeon]|nr:hypothetical protein [Thermoplasmatales archaeon]
MPIKLPGELLLCVLIVISVFILAISLRQFFLGKKGDFTSYVKTSSFKKCRIGIIKMKICAILAMLLFFYSILINFQYWPNIYFVATSILTFSVFVAFSSRYYLLKAVGQQSVGQQHHKQKAQNE